MKYIDKSNPNSLAGKAFVDKWKIDNQNKINLLASQGKKDDLWGEFPKKRVRDYLYIEQGELCCYCGCELTKRTHQLVIEHHKLKSLEPQNQYPNMFDYDNLLLSCHGNKYEFYEVKNGDTWVSIASKPISSFDVKGLKVMNPDIKKDGNEPQQGECLIVSPKKGKESHHCDNYRGEKDLSINPAKLPDCIDRFIYTAKLKDKEGEITPKADDVEADEAVRNLNLNAPILIKKRAKIVKDARSLLDDISSEIISQNATERQEIIEIANEKIAGIKEFYVVFRAYLRDDFPELFS